MENKNNFYAGLEEGIARILGLILTVIFFVIYITASEKIEIDWYSGTGMLVLFWLVYEAISLVLFIMFSFFGKNKLDKDNKKSEPADNVVENIN
jgi:hypothetical protein